MKLLTTIAALIITVSLNAQTKEISYDIEHDRIYLEENMITLNEFIRLLKSTENNTFYANKVRFNKRCSQSHIRIIPNTLKVVGGITGLLTFTVGQQIYSWSGWGSNGNLAQERREERQGISLMLVSTPFLALPVTIKRRKGYEKQYKRSVVKAITKYNASLKQ